MLQMHLYYAKFENTSVLGNIWKIGKWTKGGKPECWSLKEKLSGINRTEAYTSENSSFLWWGKILIQLNKVLF